jgi:KUP system potassium uptake protein
MGGVQRTAPERRATEPPAPARAGRLALAALGVVYGDIGTSPLYTLRACMTGDPSLAPNHADVLGVLSLIIWALTLVVSMKYLAFIMRADNRGEGGIFALLALLPESARPPKVGRVGVAAALVIVGAGLLYGDGIITPAISVLSAVEGLQVAAPGLRPLVLPVTCVVLVALFAIQSRGTGRIGRWFGPLMAVWFVTIGVIGARNLIRVPGVLAAVNPVHALRFFAAHGWRGFRVLGSVVLAVTGGEALYADLGHFGARPIRLGWTAMVMPALALSYLGQGALILARPSTVSDPFFSGVSSAALTYALVGLSAVATVIASQALITGAFSLTHQAIQLGFLPPLTIRHTSADREGQIYIPEVNFALAVCCLAVVLGFRHSSRLAGAYGVAVTGTMAITSVMFFLVTCRTWRWPRWRAGLLLAAFLAVDLPFVGANLLKVVDGGYVSIVIAAVLFVVMFTWKRGRLIFAARLRAQSPPLDSFLARCASVEVVRTSAAGVFLTGHPEGAPPVLADLTERVRAIPGTVVLVTMRVSHAPRSDHRAIQVEALGRGVYRMIVERGYLEDPDLPGALEQACREHGLPIDPARVTVYVGRATFVASSAGDMGRLSEGIFAFIARNARPLTDHFGIPPHQVVELGSRVDL